jgi:hypothetical protein
LPLSQSKLKTGTDPMPDISVSNWVELLMHPLRQSSDDWRFPPAASRAEILTAERRLGFGFDKFYAAFLLYSNGPTIGGDGTISFTSVSEHGPNSFTNVIDERAIAEKLLPVCTDGCGNEYVLDCHSSSPSPVAFFDRTLPKGEPEYFVASDFRHFLRFFIYNSGLAMPGWPFDRSQFEEWDPSFLETVPEPLQPWNRR